MGDHVIIYVNGKRLAIGGDDVFSPLVEFLRQRGLVGTKIGCGEGDCGACTVLAGAPNNGSIRYRPIVSCMRPVHQLDGMHSLTVEVEGIAGVSTVADVPGDNHFGPIFHGEELLAARECHYIGQPIVVLAGENRAALRAARAAIQRSS